MRIAIVNDMLMAVELLRRVVENIPDCEIAWCAHDGQEAVEKCAADTPDLIIMDIVMPKLNGVEATRQIMKKSPCPILIVTATVDGNSANVFEALGEGALDAINTPSLEDITLDGTHTQGIVRKINMLRKLAKPQRRQSISPTPKKSEQDQKTAPILVAIGSSTGGPKALEKFFSEIPANINAMFVVVQHIDKQFAAGMASWLAANSHLQVRIASPGDSPEQGTILLAGTNDHMILKPDMTLDYTINPEDNPFRPSVDVFFNSLADNWKVPGIAALLTGIGNDGAEGLLKLRQNSWHTFAQDCDSCVVYGMPKAAARLGAAQEIIPPEEIGRRIIELTLSKS